MIIRVALMMVIQTMICLALHNIYDHTWTCWNYLLLALSNSSYVNSPACLIAPRSLSLTIWDIHAITCMHFVKLPHQSTGNTSTVTFNNLTSSGMHSSTLHSSASGSRASTPPLHKNSGPCSHNDDCINSPGCIHLVNISVGLTSHGQGRHLSGHISPCISLTMWLTNASTLRNHFRSTLKPQWNHSNNNIYISKQLQ